MRSTALLSLTLSLFALPSLAQSASYRVLPANVTLSGAQSSQRLLVERVQDERYTGDFTARATFASSNPRVAVVGKNGEVRSVGNGTATITAKVGGATAQARVTVERFGEPFRWSFRNHVLPVLTKAACNSGACHGAAAGKGGLKLTLRGFDAQWDYDVLTRQAMGRRVVAGRPDHSLLVNKPTMEIAHGGGERVKKNSVDHRVLAGWVAAGAPRPRASDATISGLDVYPPNVSLRRGDKQQFRVSARYSDGRTEDVTRWVKFGSSDSQVAAVDDNGAVKVTGNGEAAITVWFSSRVTFARVVSPFAGTSTTTPSSSAKKGYIDNLIERKLAALNLPTSPRCTDEQFIRRAYLDAAGILPKAGEVEAFLRDTSPDKRTRLVESLLSRPEFVDYWTYKWSDLLLVSSRKLSGPALPSFYNWIRKSVEENKPWDRFARELLTAQGSNLDNGAVNYWVLHKEPIDQTETTTQAFMGMSVQCARCHNHPLEKWTQSDYYQMANLFARVRLKNGDRSGEVLAVVSREGDIDHPRLGKPLPPRPLDGEEVPQSDVRDRRQALAEWLTAPENPYFARSIVNRVWRSLMGRGLVEVEDDLRLTNPASNEELLAALCADFVKGGYDIKRLIRSIMMSDTYQRSSDPVGLNAKDDRYYSRYLPKRLSAEVMLDALSQVAGAPTAFDGYPSGTRALQLRDSQVGSYFLSAFGRPQREQTCSCERTQEPSIAQALHLANGDTINQKLQASRVISGLILEEATNEEVLRLIYLSALSREPTAAEKSKLLPILAESVPDPLAPVKEAEAQRRQALEDLFWAVLTDREFLFNH